MRINLFIFALLFLFGCEKNVQLKVPALVSDNLVLQRNAENKLWGWANPGENIKIDFPDSTYQAVANKDGEWSVNTKKYDYSPTPIEIKISNNSTAIIIKNVMFGDVWICSGQSNMELPIKRVLPLYKDEIDVYNSNIRYF